MATFERHEGRDIKGIDPDAKDRDLEQYGVWVKAEPQDILEEPDIESATPFAEGAETEVVPDDSFLTDEEEIFLGAGSGLAAPDSSISQEKTPSLHEEDLTIPGFEQAFSDTSQGLSGIPDIEELESLEDLGVPIEEFTPEADAAGEKPSAKAVEFQDVSEFSLDESGPVLEEGAETDFESIDIDLKFDDTLPPRPEAKGASVAAPAPSSADGFETVTDFDDFLNDPESQGAELKPESRGPAAEPKQATPRPAPVPKSDEFSLDDIPEFPNAAEIDDMAELEKELSAHSGGAREVPPDASSDILLKIAGELSSIKQELVSLKSQIAAMKSESGASRGEGSEDGQGADGGKAGGFFDDEEDETIALTGDELDNILNTAEFSEESAEIGGNEDKAEQLSDMEDLLPESGDYSRGSTPAESEQEPGIEEMQLPDEDEADMALPIEDAAVSSLAEEGVAPLTPPPEDTSYLEGSLEEDDALPLLDDEDLPDAPLMEPSPEELDIDDLVEDHFEDAEELPLAEFETASDTEEPEELLEEVEELEELTLDVDSEPSSLVLETPEHIEMPIPEIEEIQDGSDETLPEFVEELPAEEDFEGFSEIALHHEESPLPAEDLSEVAELEPVEEEPPLQAAGPTSESEDLLVEDLEPVEDHPEPVPNRIKDEVRSVLSYLDKLLESLPEEKIEEFAKSEHFETYKRLFEELGLV